MPALLLYFGCCSLWRVVTSFTDSSEVNKTRVHHFLFPLRISNYPEFAFKSVSFGYCNQLLVSHVFVTINYLKLGNFIPVHCKYNGRSVARLQFGHARLLNGAETRAVIINLPSFSVLTHKFLLLPYRALLLFSSQHWTSVTHTVCHNK